MRRFAHLPIALTLAVVGGMVGLTSVAAAPAPAPPTNHQGLWWHAPSGSESGWGINFEHQGDVIFATWFTYDANGKPWWLSMTAQRTAESTYGGTLIETRGPAFASVPFDPGKVVRTAVGSGTLAFHEDGSHAQFSYTIAGARQTKALTRQVWGPLPTCAHGAAPEFSTATNYQGLWWVANGVESGWGINLAHQNDILFATWFTYDEFGAPAWLSGTAVKAGPGVYAGDLITTSGPPYSSAAFDDRAVTRTVAGTLVLAFIDGNTAVFSSTVGGVAQTKIITRELFVPPAGTLCRDAPAPPAVTIETPTQTLNVGDRMLPLAVAHHAAGVVRGAGAIWSTSDPAVATFDPYGRNELRAVAPGKVVLSAMVGGVTGTQMLTVLPAMRVAATVGAPEVVFRWATDRCAETDTPDQQPRAGRAEDGSIVVFAGNAPRYYVSRGADFGSLRRDCSRPALESAYRPDPASYENGEWPWVFYREGNRWHTLIGNEYHDAVASTCKPGDPEPANPCWYNAVTHAVSTDGARTFAKPLAPAHVVAPPPYAWTPPSPGDQPSTAFFPQGKFFEGYGAPNGIFRRNDGYLYAVMHVTPGKSDPANNGACVMRTDRLDDPGSWRAWDGSGFNLTLASPYVTGRAGPMCRLYRFFSMGSTFSTYFDRYIGVSMGGQKIDGRQVCGVYLNLSADLFHWSSPLLIAESNSLSCIGDAGNAALLEPVIVDYVSLIDHADPTVNFEQPGRTPYLYYVRFNRDKADPLFWLDRDLVRVPLTFTRLD